MKGVIFITKHSEKVEQLFLQLAINLLKSTVYRAIN